MEGDGEEKGPEEKEVRYDIVCTHTMMMTTTGAMKAQMK